MTGSRSFVLLIFCSFSFFASAQKTEGEVIEQIVAIIGDEIILKSELEGRYSEMKAQGFVNNAEKAKCSALEDIMYTKLLLNQARIDSVVVTQDEVDSELERRMQYFVSQVGSESALEEYFKKSIQEIKDELRENLYDQIVAQRMQGTINEGVKVTPSEVKTFFDNITQDSLPLINSEVEVSQIVFLAPVSKEEKQKAKDKLNEIRKRIVDGEDFSTLAILYSEDPGTARKGGELGFVGRAEVDPAFGAVAFKLKGSEVSRIVESQFGLHIIQLIERRGEKVNVRHILIKPKITGDDIAKSRVKADSILNLINTNDTLSFDEAAYLFSEDKESKNNGGKVVNPMTGSSIFELDQLDPGLYYAIEKLDQGEISEPVAYKSVDGKQGYRLVMLLKKTEAHRANLRQDYQRVQKIALQNKKTEKAREWTAARIEKTHIRIADEYQSCSFVNPWVEQKVNN